MGRDDSSFDEDKDDGGGSGGSRGSLSRCASLLAMMRGFRLDGNSFSPVIYGDKLNNQAEQPNVANIELARLVFVLYFGSFLVQYTSLVPC